MWVSDSVLHGNNITTFSSKYVFSKGYKFLILLISILLNFHSSLYYRCCYTTHFWQLLYINYSDKKNRGKKLAITFTYIYIFLLLKGEIPQEERKHYASEKCRHSIECVQERQ